VSFILDALKKSEAERQRHAAPGFADIPRGQDRPRTQTWLWVVGGLLAVNLVVLLAVFLLPASDTNTPAPATEPPLAAAPMADEQAFAAMVAEARKNRPEQERPTTSEPPRAAPSEAAAVPGREGPAAAQPEPAPRGTVSESPASFQDLRAAGALQLPDLHLDIHVYSETPAERFAFINMSKYTERDTLKEGPLVREITPDGVVLEQAGTVFLLPRR
jgi:general secretion pathway protein B